MASTPAYARTTWFFKFCESLLAAIAVLNILMMGAEFLPRSFREANPNFFENWLMGMVGIAVLSSIVFTVLWHRRERRGVGSSSTRHAWLQGIIRYWLAFEISVYGFAKILKTQLQSPSYRLDMPMGEVNGFGLTWYYFGYSYTLAVIIALFQIGGSVLLLYRRTTLLGVMVLLPVMVNIIFINFFYNIATGAFFNSVVFTIGLVFLLLLDVPKLKAAFWDLTDHLPPVTLGRNWAKHALRVLPIAAAFALIGYYVRTDDSDKTLKGTWAVKTLTRNGRVLPANAWLADTTAWNRVYFAGPYGCAFSPNPYRYKPAESLRGEYKFDGRKDSLQIVFFRGKNDEKVDTLRASVSERTDKALRVHGTLWGDTLDLNLARLR